MLKCEACGDDSSALMQYWFEPSIKLTLCLACSNRLDPHVLLKKKGSICGNLKLFGNYIASQYGKHHSHNAGQCAPDEPKPAQQTVVITDDYGHKVIYSQQR